MRVEHSTYETVAADPALETLGQGVPVLITQRHSLVLNKKDFFSLNFPQKYSYRLSIFFKKHNQTHLKFPKSLINPGKTCDKAS